MYKTKDGKCSSISRPGSINEHVVIPVTRVLLITIKYDKSMKNYWILFHRHVLPWRKILLTMKLCVLFLLFFNFTLSAVTFSQQRKVNLHLTSVKLKTVFDEIQRQTGYLFVFNSQQARQIGEVSINANDRTVEDVLKELLSGKGYTYTFENEIIVVAPDEKKKELPVLKGSIADEKNLPLPGVTILVKGTQNGVTSDVNGNFTIKLQMNDTLIISFIGMKTQYIRYTGQKEIKIVLREDKQELEEVVITGYQVIEKRNLTSSIFSVKGEDVIEPVNNTLDKMLQGKIPGMSVMQMSSTIGAAPKIRIRGSSSILGNREPVWVLDGVILDDPVPLDVTELNSMDKINLIGNAISGLNPEDIDRIDILKDASATAIYGVKAANGVIVITTKRGKVGTPSIRYSTSLNMIQRPRVQDMHLMNSKERIELSEEIHERGLEFINTDIVGQVGYEGELKKLYGNQITLTQFNQNVKKLKDQNTDWYDLLFRNSFSHSHTLSISGGSEKLTYYFSTGYSNQKGTSLKENGERFNFLANFDARLTEKLKVQFNLGSSFSTTKRPHSSIDLYKFAYTTSRAIPVYNEDGTYAYFDKKTAFKDTPPLNYNILNELATTGNKEQNRSINAQLNLTYQFFPHLSLNTILACNTSSTKHEEYAAEDSYYVSVLRGTVYGYTLPKDDKEFLEQCQLPYGGVLSSDNMDNTNYMARASVNFNKSLGIHSLSATAGFEARTTRYSGITTQALGYLPDRGKKVTTIEDMKWVGYHKELQQRHPVVTDKKDNYLSYYGVVSYGYNNLYILNFNIRGDGSNKFGQDKSARFLPIWSISGRWNLANESFLSSSKWLDDLNLRASWGLQGNVTDAHNPNMVVSLGSIDTKSEFYESTLVSLPNPRLVWEKTRSFNIGLDFAICKQILSGTIEYYSKKGKDQLVSTEITSTNGASSVVINNGDMENKGWELSLTSTPIHTRLVTWGLSFNTSKNYNKISNAQELSTTYENYLDGTIIRNGRAVNSFYSYRFDGLDKNGLPQYLGINTQDENGETVISSLEETFASGLAYSGKREADFTGGLSTYLKVKDFRLNVLFAFSLGAKVRLNDLYDNDNAYLPTPGQNMSDEFVDRWRKPGDEAYTNIPKIMDQIVTFPGLRNEEGEAYIAKNVWQMYNNSDLRVVSGDFLRCRSIELSYYVPEKILKTCHLKYATLSLGVSNPFVIKDKKLKGRDPEQVTLGAGTVPPRPTYSFSLSVTL